MKKELLLKREMKSKLAGGLALTFLFGVSAGYSNTAQAISTTASVTASVIAALAITKTQDLDYGEGIQGDAAKVVAPNDGTSARFAVAGEPSRTYTVTLPADGVVTLTTGDGSGADKQIALTSFASNPAAGANGSLDNTGAEVLKVGATRAALSATQVTGSYTGSFTVTVVY